LFVPFLCAGLALATILAADPAHIGRLYGADLLGAGLGCAVSVVLIDRVSPPGVVMLAAGAFGLAGVRVARATLPRSARVLGLVATAIAFALMLAPERLPDVVVDNTKQMNPKDRPPVLCTRWSSFFRVGVMYLPLFAHTSRALIHDGMWGSVLPRIDDDPALAKRLEDDPRALPFAILPAAPTVTIIGSAGGTEIVTALHLGAKHVTGVELNPVTVGLLRGPFKAYTGNLADDPRVRLVNAEGRAYLAGTAEQSDLMWFDCSAVPARYA